LKNNKTSTLNFLPVDISEKEGKYEIKGGSPFKN
jgi:hypothetical protein